MRRPGEQESCCQAGYPTITPQLRTAIEKLQTARARALVASRRYQQQGQETDRAEFERWLAVGTRCADELSAARVYPEELNHYIHAHRIGTNTANPERCG